MPSCGQWALKAITVCAALTAIQDKSSSQAEVLWKRWATCGASRRRSWQRAESSLPPTIAFTLSSRDRRALYHGSGSDPQWLTCFSAKLQSLPKLGGGDALWGVGILCGNRL